MAEEKKKRIVPLKLKIKRIADKINCQLNWYESSLNNQQEVVSLIRSNLEKLNEMVGKL